jgi:DeoR family transcriptional regulator, aga operon transcriptional repressor
VDDDDQPEGTDGGPRRRYDRLGALLELLRPDGSSGVGDLAAQLGVSQATVRRDLTHLARQGLVKRTHGGATRAEVGYELPIPYRSGSHADEKRRIALAARRLVRDGAVVGFTGGTTTTQVARAIASRRELTAVTNALNIAAELALRRDVRLVVTGGVARPASFELSGPDAEEMLARYNIDVAFVGVDGIHPEGGCTTHDHVEARTNGVLVARAQQVVVVCDNTKVGRVAFAKICSLTDVDILITDEGADEDTIGSIVSQGVKVERV